MSRTMALAALLPLAACAVPAALGSPAGIAMISAIAGAAAAGARLDQTIVCAFMAADGIAEARSASAVCRPAGAAGVP